MDKQLLLIMIGYVFGMGLLGVGLFIARFRAVRTGEVSAKYFKIYTGPGPSEQTIKLGRHYDNQFQVPILFLIGGAVHLSRGPVTTGVLIAAWIFVISRVLHSWIHLGRNHVLKRAGIFALSWLAVLALWAQLWPG